MSGTKVIFWINLLFGVLCSRFQFDVRCLCGTSAYTAALCMIIISVIASRTGTVG
ncbi:hypothetical protein GQ44DRAFT_710031 [Phaeosphaeriaceae sp. PMI808]|nr:hypothetical protein GQ44DRAFT_710031 [Phaeosphaeriaceae sp. PMI808]